MARERKKKSSPVPEIHDPVSSENKPPKVDTRPKGDEITWGNQITQHEHEWLVSGWIPLASVTVIGGASGSGKTTLLAALAAQVAGGAPLLEEDQGGPHKTLWYTVEEQIGSMVARRLEAALCPVDKVGFPCHGKTGQIQRRLCLPVDLDHLQQTILSTRALLVVLDPVSSFLTADTNPLDGKQVRFICEGLEGVAAVTGCAIVMTLHDRKSRDGPSIDHFGGSAAWTQTPRIVVRLGKDAEEDNRFLICSEKCSLGRKPRSRFYTLEDRGAYPRFRLGQETDYLADDLSNEVSGATERDALMEAKEFLKLMVGSGEMKAETIKGQADKDGLAWGTVRRAKVALKITSHRKPHEGSHFAVWRMPEGGFPKD